MTTRLQLLRLLLGFAIATAPAQAYAGPPAGTPTSDPLKLTTLQPGSSQWSLQGRSRVGLGRQLELTTSVAGWLLATPNLGVRAHLNGIAPRGQLHAEFGVSLPTFAMSLTRGYLFPTHVEGERPKYWTIVPAASVTWSFETGAVQLATNASLAYAVALNGALPPALDTLAPIELAFAPVTRTFRAGLEKNAGVALSRRLTALGKAALFVTGPSQSRTSSIFVRAGAGLQAEFSSRWAMQVQATWYNYDQGKVEIHHSADGFATTKRIRSNDIWPTVDLIWRPKQNARRTN